jgi:hypothetical protein
MKLALTQSNYLPWIGYFKLISKVDHFVFYDQVQYTKNDWRNRNKIMLNGSPKWISIPINYRFSERLSIDKVRLPSGNWRNDHLEKISMGYNSEDNFSQYYPNLNKIISTDYDFLSELNQALLIQYAQTFKIATHFHSIHNIDLNLERNQRIIETCKDFSADTYVCSPKSLNYIDLPLFSKNNIEVEIMNFDNCLNGYKQNSQEFDPYVSFIDLLFMTGIDGVRECLASSIL